MLTPLQRREGQPRPARTILDPSGTVRLARCRARQDHARRRPPDGYLSGAPDNAHNSRGQLGDGTTTNSSIPVAVSGLSGVKGSGYADHRHTCAVLTGGSVRCWGNNSEGQLGDGTTTNSLTPVAVPGLSGVTALAAGAYHTCARLTDGSVRCWGVNNFGELGDGTTTSSLTPVAVSGLSGVTALAVSDTHTCAVLTDGSVRCWGNNDEVGQLGDGTTTSSSTPITVPGLSGVAELAAGSSHTCAVLTDGSVRCWGWNGYGQLGDGTNAEWRRTPTLVAW